jgi:hypothetical protein
MQMPLTPPARRVLAMVMTMALIIGAASLLTNASAAPRASGSGARLVLTSKDPITVSGHGFRPRARVHVRLVMERTFSRSPLVNRHGAFTVSFPAVIDRCSTWSLSAGQPHQTTVVLRGPAKPECAPASAP